MSRSLSETIRDADGRLILDDLVLSGSWTLVYGAEIEPMKYRKKPVVIEAQRWDGDNMLELQSWAHAGMSPETNSIIIHDGYTLRVRTLEGWLNASVGDMIIRGVKGEFYPCKPDIFDDTYELAE